MTNRALLRPCTKASAMLLADVWFGAGSDMARAVAPQLAAAVALRTLAFNGRTIMLGGVVQHEGWRDAFLIVDPEWTAPPKGMLRIVRKLRFAAQSLASGDLLIIHTRTPAGARLAKSAGCIRLRTIRLHDLELEVWRVVVQEASPFDHGRAFAAHSGGAGGRGPEATRAG